MFYNDAFEESTIDGVEFSDEELAELDEAYIADELSCLSEEARSEFLSSEECSLMEAKGLINKKTMVRLNKNDDISRRQTMACIYLAKKANDPLFKKLALNRVKERALLSQIKKKYGMKAKSVAKRGQREFLSKRMPAKFMRPADLKAGREKANTHKI